MLNKDDHELWLYSNELKRTQEIYNKHLTPKMLPKYITIITKILASTINLIIQPSFSTLVVEFTGTSKQKQQIESGNHTNDVYMVYHKLSELVNIKPFSSY